MREKDRTDLVDALINLLKGKNLSIEGAQEILLTTIQKLREETKI